MNIKFKAEFAFFIFLIVFLVGTLSAITYFNSKSIFDAKISYVNNVKMPYSIIVDINNKISTNLKYEIDVIYKRENLVVASKSVSCSGECETKLNLKKVFFDRYDVILRTKYNGHFYEKRLSFILNKKKTGNRVLIKPVYFLNNISGGIDITGKILLEKPSKIILETFPENEESLKTKTEITCKTICDFSLPIKSNILFQKYKLNIYFPNDVISKEYFIKYSNNADKTKINASEFLSLNFHKNIKKIKVLDLFGSEKEIAINNKNVKLPNIYQGVSVNGSRNNYVKLKPEIHSIEKLSEMKKLKSIKFKKKVGFLNFANSFSIKNSNYNLNPIVSNQSSIFFDNGKKYIELKNLSLFDKKRRLQPGIYKEQRVTRYLDGTEDISESFFAYGLISINTKKPIYHVGEMSKMFIVVLDKWGRLVSNASIILNITKPSGKSVILRSSNLDIYETAKKGVYTTSFLADEPGKYKLHAQVDLSDMVVDVSSYFNAVDHYDFDILRNVPSTIDPWQGPFNNTFTIEPLNNYSGYYNFTEVFSSDFTEIKTDADKIKTIGDTTYLIWENLSGISKLRYSAQTPLASPYLYYLGKSWIDYGNKRFYENRSWLFAIDPAARVCTFVSPCYCGSGCAGGNEPGSGTIDSCTDGNTNYEYTNNIRVTDLNGSYYGTGDTVQVCIDNNCDTDFGGDRSIIGYKDASAGWVNGDIIFQTGGTGSATACLGITTYCKNVTLTNYVGTHNFRGGVAWNGLSNQICDNQFYQDYDDVNISVLQRRPAYYLQWSLDNGTNTGNNLNVIRGENITIFAKWDKPIQSAVVNHDGDGIYKNFSISNLNSNYTNYTADTSNLNEFSNLGIVKSKITANDLYFNLSNTTSPQKTFYIYGALKINQSKMIPYIMYNGSSTNIFCQAVDENVGVPYGGVNISYYNNVSGYLGSSLTNLDGWSNISYVENNIGNYTITCNFTNQLSNYYFAGNHNYANQLLTVKKNNTDITPPKIVNVSATPNLFSVGGLTTIKANVTDNINLTDVYINITLPNGISYVYSMINTNSDWYEYNFSNTVLDGNYNYYIYAYDNSSNKGWSSEKSFTVVGIRTYIGIKTAKNVYKIGEKINLTPYSKVSIVNNSNYNEIGDTGNILYTFDTGFEGWTHGGAQDQWEWGTPSSAFNSNCDLSSGIGNNCLAVNLVGNYNANADEWVASPIINFSGRTNIQVNFWRSLELQDGTTTDRAYFEGNDGTAWKIYFQDSLLGGGVPYTLSPGFATFYMPELDGISDGQIRFRLTSDATTNYDGWDVDSVNLSFSPRENWNKTWEVYNSSFGTGINKTTAIKFAVNVTSYSSVGSDIDGTYSPDLEIQVFNGTSYSGNYKCNLDSTKIYPYLCEFVIKNTPEYLNAWKYSKNRSIRIRAINLDHNDFINWTDIKREYVTPSIIENHGIVPVTSYLLEQFKNSTGGIVKSVYNQSINLNPEQAYQLNNYWNFSVPNEFQLGNYSAYVALTDLNGNVLKNADDQTYINDSYKFQVQSLFINTLNPSEDSTQPEDFYANITLNTKYFGSGGWCGYSLDGLANVTLIQASSTNFYGQLQGITDGEHNIRFFCNDTQNYIVDSGLVDFNVSQAPRIFFVNPTDANNSFVNRSWTYINTSINDSSNTSAFFDFNRSLIGYWNFENASPTTVYDYSSYGNDGTFMNGAHINNSNMIRGNYGEFDGVDDYVKTTYVQSNILKYTIEAWVKTTANKGVIFEDRTSGSGKSITLAIGPSCGGSYCPGSSAGVPAVGLDSNAIWIGVNGITPINDGKWHQITGVFSSTYGQVISPSNFKLYVDGNLVSGPTGKIGTSISPLSGLNGAYIGYHQTWYEYFNGSIDEVMIFNRTLSSKEIKALYNSKYNKLEYNFSKLKNGKYDYSACAIDRIGNYNCTRTRVININRTLPEITILSPLAGTKFNYNQTILLNITTLAEANWTGYKIDSSSTVFNLSKVSTLNWDKNLFNLNGGYHKIIFFAKDSGGNVVNKSTYFYNVPGKDVFVRKRIQNINNLTYKVILNVTNYGKWTNYDLYDFIDSGFNYFNLSLLSNGSSTVSGQYSGKILIWNMSLPPFTSKEIVYYMNSSVSHFNLQNNFMYGVE